MMKNINIAEQQNPKYVNVTEFTTPDLRNVIHSNLSPDLNNPHLDLLKDIGKPILTLPIEKNGNYIYDFHTMSNDTILDATKVKGITIKVGSNNINVNGTAVAFAEGGIYPVKGKWLLGNPKETPHCFLLERINEAGEFAPNDGTSLKLNLIGSTEKSIQINNFNFEDGLETMGFSISKIFNSAEITNKIVNENIISRRPPYIYFTKNDEIVIIFSHVPDQQNKAMMTYVKIFDSFGLEKVSNFKPIISHNYNHEIKEWALLPSDKLMSITQVINPDKNDELIGKIYNLDGSIAVEEFTIQLNQDSAGREINRAFINILPNNKVMVTWTTKYGFIYSKVFNTNDGTSVGDKFLLGKNAKRVHNVRSIDDEDNIIITWKDFDNKFKARKFSKIGVTISNELEFTFSDKNTYGILDVFSISEERFLIIYKSLYGGINIVFQNLNKGQSKIIRFDIRFSTSPYFSFHKLTDQTFIIKYVGRYSKTFVKKIDINGNKIGNTIKLDCAYPSILTPLSNGEFMISFFDGKSKIHIQKYNSNAQLIQLNKSGLPIIQNDKLLETYCDNDDICNFLGNWGNNDIILPPNKKLYKLNLGVGKNDITVTPSPFAKIVILNFKPNDRINLEYFIEIRQPDNLKITEGANCTNINLPNNQVLSFIGLKANEINLSEQFKFATKEKSHYGKNLAFGALLLGSFMTGGGTLATTEIIGYGLLKKWRERNKIDRNLNSQKYRQSSELTR